MASPSKTRTTGGRKRRGAGRPQASSATAIEGKARREARRAAADIAASAEARRARMRAHAALDALRKAGAAATALVRAAWRTSGAHIHTLTGSREVRSLQASARRAAQAAADAARAAGVTAGKRGEKVWKNAASLARQAMSRAPAAKSTGRRKRAATTRRSEPD